MKVNNRRGRLTHNTLVSTSGRNQFIYLRGGVYLLMVWKKRRVAYFQSKVIKVEKTPQIYSFLQTAEELINIQAAHIYMYILNI